jgi:hypothetical protein
MAGGHPADQAGLTGRHLTPAQNQAIRDRYDRQQQALTGPGTLGRGQGPVSQQNRPGGIDPDVWQQQYEQPGGVFGVAGGQALEHTRQQSLDALLGFQGGDFMQQLQGGISDWMANPQAWSDQAQRMMETGIREEGAQQLRGQQYGIGRSLAQRGQGDSGTRLALEQRAASAQEAATLENIREAKIAREQQNLQAKGMAYSAGQQFGNLGANIAGMIADTYMGTTYDPSGAAEMAMTGELMPQVLEASQFATGQQNQAMQQNMIMQMLGMFMPGQGMWG